MKMQPNEILIMSSDRGIVELSNLRIGSDFKDLGYQKSVVIYLEDISSIQVISKNYVAYIAVAILAGLYTFLALSQNSNGPALLGFSLAAIMVIIWWVTRKRIIAIYPNGGRPLEMEANRMRSEEIKDFIEKVQLAKTQRLQTLYNINHN
ncbi:MAG: hypothetical protein H0X33_08650 [Taibaiella sp.]|nr:hypothetical protein [Taibaiella sp.]